MPDSKSVKYGKVYLQKRQAAAFCLEQWEQGEQCSLERERSVGKCPYQHR